jgi:hypothetical protein
MVRVESKDEECLEKIFGGTEGNRRSQVPNMNYTEVDSYAPITAALQAIISLGSRDLVIIGRGGSGAGPRIPSGSHLLRGMEGDRRKVLGDIAESVLICNQNISLLVVQGHESKNSIAPVK